MRIGISCYPTIGGSGVIATELAMALADQGDEVHIISYALPSRLDLLRPRLHYHEVIVPRYPLFEYPPYSLALATRMVQITRGFDLEVLHVHYAVPNAVSAVLARQILTPHPVKVVTTLHGTDISLVGSDPNYLETTRFGIEQSDAVTAVSQHLKTTTYDLLEVEKPIEVIPNFVDPRRCRRVDAGKPLESRSRKRAPLLVHVSNFRPVKRVLDVVRVFAEVRRRMPVRLLLVGDGPEREEVHRYCQTHGLVGDVTFAGNLLAVEEVLVAADLFLLPSESESFGLAALEAMGCGVPVLATHTGGLPEVIEDGVCGFLVPVGDVAGMAAAAERLLKDEELRRRMGRAARKRAVEHFSQDRIVDRYRNVYRRVLAS